MIKLTVLLAVAFIAVVAANEPSNHEFISNINKKQKSWTAGENKITRMGKAYVNRLMGTKLESINNIPVLENSPVNADIPDTFDAREKWPNCKSLFAIKDQGGCGCCWAVATASVASDRLCIKSGSQIQLNLAAEHLMGCCKYCVDRFTTACDGGYIDRAWVFVKNTGLATGGDYKSNEGCLPYEIPPAFAHPANTPSCRRQCTNRNYQTPLEQDKHAAESAYRLPSGNVQAIQSEILNNGPVEGGFIVYSDFPYYKGGVYRQTSRRSEGGHAVRILGWGTENGEPYWLIANSWGNAWGINGTFKIRRGTNECGIESMIVAGQLSK